MRSPPGVRSDSVANSVGSSSGVAPIFWPPKSRVSGSRVRKNPRGACDLRCTPSQLGTEWKKCFFFFVFKLAETDIFDIEKPSAIDFFRFIFRGPPASPPQGMKFLPDITVPQPPPPPSPNRGDDARGGEEFATRPRSWRATQTCKLSRDSSRRDAEKQKKKKKKQ